MNYTIQVYLHGELCMVESHRHCNKSREYLYVIYGLVQSDQLSGDVTVSSLLMLFNVLDPNPANSHCQSVKNVLPLSSDHDRFQHLYLLQ